MERDQLVAYWQRRQAELAALFEEYGASRSDFRIDGDRNQFLLVDEHGLPLVAAEAKAILSYAFSSSSILMAWANESVPKKSAIKAQKDLPHYIPDASEEDAWHVAMIAAYTARAEYLYRAPSPQLLAFYALRNVRRAGAEDRFEAGSPRSFVMSVLVSLAPQLEEKITTRAQKLFRNQGAVVAKQADLFPGDEKIQALLVETGATLARMGDAMKVGKKLSKARRTSWDDELGALWSRWKRARLKRPRRR